MAKEMNNRQAYFNYLIEDKYVAGVVLLGTEVKSIREGKISFNDAYCLFDKDELWLRGFYIAEYKLGTVNNHIAVHDRKLLLTQRELRRIQAKMKEMPFINLMVRKIGHSQFRQHEVFLHQSVVQLSPI